MLFQISLGVDIRENGLCLACLKASSRNIQLVAHAAYPFEEGITEGEKPNAISGLIQDFIRENRISPTSVFLGLRRDTAILRYLEFPIAVKENLRETLGYEMEKYVPFGAEDAYFDFQVISEDKAAGRLQLLLVVVKKDTISPFLETSRLLGIGISGVEVSSTALADYFFSVGEKGGQACKSFIYKSEQSLELGLVQDGILRYSRVLLLDEDIMEVIPTALETIRQESGEGEEPLDVLFCGAETDIPLLEGLYGKDGINISLLDLSSARIPSAAVIVAYGLALKGVRKTSMNINLLPPSLRKKPSRFKLYAMFGLMSLVFLGSLAWGGGVFFQHQWTLEHLEKEIGRLGAQLKEIERTGATKKNLEDRIDHLNTLRRGGPPVLDVLRELSERVPEDAWVNKFDFSEKSVQIQGEASSASELIPLLEASPMFGDVAFLSAITKARNAKEKFRIGLSLK